MRIVTMILGLALMVLAGLWFFTPVLDTAYSSHAPGIARSHGKSAALQTPGTRSAAPNAPNASSSSQIGSKALADNVMSMINLGTGLLGAWFTFMSYRLQSGSRRRERD